MILCFCFTCHQLRWRATIKVLWICACLYPAVILGACYLFQFDELQQFILSRLSASTLQDIGLSNKTGSDLFQYLVPPIVALFLCVLQFRIFFKDIPQKKLFGKCIDILTMK